MKQFLVFSFFVCFAAAKSISSSNLRLLEGNKKLAMEDCAQEYNVNEKKYVDGIGEKAIAKYSDETSCMLACNIRKMVSEEVTGSDHKTTLYNGIKKLIEEAYQNGFDKEHTNVIREEVVNEVEQCYTSTDNECDFIKCSNFYDGPLLMLFFFNGENPVGDPVFSYKF